MALIAIRRMVLIIIIPITDNIIPFAIIIMIFILLIIGTMITATLTTRIRTAILISNRSKHGATKIRVQVNFHLEIILNIRP